LFAVVAAADTAPFMHARSQQQPRGLRTRGARGLIHRGGN